MFGLGVPEMVVIAIVALLIFGPKRLPGMGRSIGTALREFKKGVETMADEVKTSADVEGISKDVEALKPDLNKASETAAEPAKAEEKSS